MSLASSSRHETSVLKPPWTLPPPATMNLASPTIFTKTKQHQIHTTETERRYKEIEREREINRGSGGRATVVVVGGRPWRWWEGDPGGGETRRRRGGREMGSMREAWREIGEMRETVSLERDGRDENEGEEHEGQISVVELRVRERERERRK
ncbi:hypothetical protein F2Q69_00013397 [Brassica cretica]|uniref:Uncharacterized protein n=1 Tax=Brassica cretica TaxID=69181 RepID=A0A8S9R882_BRACR|nr:hypothetical protein F2Q69_00013397 [Brassica cretica]